VKILKNKTSEGTNLYIIKSYRYNGKSTSQIVFKLGKEEELAKILLDTMAYASEVKKKYKKISSFLAMIDSLSTVEASLVIKSSL